VLDDLAITIPQKIFSLTTPTFSITTSENAACDITYISNNESVSQLFDSTDGVNHRISLSAPLKEGNNLARVRCSAGGESVYTDVILLVEADVPIITSADVDASRAILENRTSYRNIEVYDDTTSRLSLAVSEDSQCTYTRNGITLSFGTGYERTWSTPFTVTSDAYVTMQCATRNGVVSGQYILDIVYNPSAALIYTPLYSSSQNFDRDNTLSFSTNRPAECSMTLSSVNGNTRSTTRNVAGTDTRNGTRYDISLDSFGITPDHGDVLGFDVSCTVLETGQTVSRSFTVLSDEVAPSLTIVSPDDNTITGNYVLPVGITLDENARVTISVNNTVQQSETVGGGESSLDVVLGQGTNIITVRVEDAAGNTRQESITVYYTGDNIAPRITLINPKDGDILQRVDDIRIYAQTIFDTTLDAQASEFTLRNAQGTVIGGSKSSVVAPGGSSDSQYIFVFDPDGTLGNGVYTWEAVLVDSFGHQSAPQTGTFEINSDQPIIYLSSPITVDSLSTPEPRFTTNNQSFILAGSVVSESAIVDAYYQLYIDGIPLPSERISMSASNTFQRTVSLNAIDEGSQRYYDARIVVINDAATEEYTLSVLQDRAGPNPVSITIS